MGEEGVEVDLRGIMEKTTQSSETLYKRSVKVLSNDHLFSTTAIGRSLQAKRGIIRGLERYLYLSQAEELLVLK